jgi:hypothetical protein
MTPDFTAPNIRPEHIPGGSIGLAPRGLPRAENMYTIFAILASLVQMLYEAQVSTFGCNSSAEVAELQAIRSDAEAFQKLLYAQVAYGQCITISQGAVVEGTIDTTDTSVLRINAQSNPPGYMVPLGDFKLVKADGEQ